MKSRKSPIIPKCMHYPLHELANGRAKGVCGTQIPQAYVSKDVSTITCVSCQRILVSKGLATRQSWISDRAKYLTARPQPAPFAPVASPTVVDGSKHPTTVAGLDMKALARAVASLRYDALRDFCEELCSAIRDDAEADENRGREGLAKELRDTAFHLSIVAGCLTSVWRICKPFEIRKP